MAETEQERQVMLAALREEIAGSEHQIAYLTDEIAKLGNDRDVQAQVLMLQKDLEQHERVLVSAQAEIDLRTVPVKRGPGRPRKNPA